MTNPNLPPDILVEIFVKLPTKSVGKFRCLSKTWNTKLSAPHFINSHLSRRTYNQENLIVMTQSRPVRIITYPTKHNEVSTEFQLPNTWVTSLLGSCNGLVLLSCGDHFLVLNPITLQHATIPYPPVDLKNTTRSYGFGYDRSCDDYKFFTLSYHSSEIKSERYTIIDVYSMRSGVTKRVGYTPFAGYHVHHSSMVMPFVNDAVHWFMSPELDDCNIHIAAFDIVKETFHEAPLPKEIEIYNLDNGLVILDGCLSIADSINCGLTELWIMKEYGVVDSWVKFCIDVDGIWSVLMPVCFVGDDEILAYAEGEEDGWVLWDLLNGTVKVVVGGGIPSSHVCEWFAFVDSLVSPAIPGVPGED